MTPIKRRNAAAVVVSPIDFTDVFAHAELGENYVKGVITQISQITQMFLLYTNYNELTQELSFTYLQDLQNPREKRCGTQITQMFLLHTNYNKLSHKFSRIYGHL